MISGRLSHLLSLSPKWLLQEWISGNLCSGGLFCYLAERSSSQRRFHCAREGPALMHYSGTSVIIWFRGALLRAASLGFGHQDISRRSVEQWFMHVCIHLEPGAAPEWDKAPFSLTHSSNPSWQSRTADSTLRLCYQALCSPRFLLS